MSYPWDNSLPKVVPLYVLQAWEKTVLQDSFPWAENHAIEAFSQKGQEQNNRLAALLAIEYLEQNDNDEKPMADIVDQLIETLKDFKKYL